MESKHIIIVLLVIIVILAAAIGITVLHPFDSKEPSKVKITFNDTLTEGESLSIKLTDLNNTGMPKEIVNVTVTDSEGKVVFDNVVKTDSEGNAKVDLGLKNGEYNVSVAFGGNENYTGNSTAQNLTIKEEVVQETTSQSTSTSSQDSQREEDKVTPDGWDPKEHEVSRKSIGDGNERVSYDDGYFRVVDKDGDVVNYGWA